MKIRSLKLVCFSPTGTTRAVLQGIARGVGLPAEVVDVTTPNARNAPFVAHRDDLLLLGVPVYMGRVPDLLADWLGGLDLRRTPTACVIVYGNRAYENALRELTDVVAARGGFPFAAAAFIGEHSFSSTELPASEGRPDASDLNLAEGFGRRIAAELRSVAGFEPGSKLSVPGSFPYGGITKLWDVDFIQVDERCSQCGACALQCPSGAIDPGNSAAIDTAKCVTCCACIKSCPQQARSKKPGPVMDASHRIHTNFAEPKEPELFFISGASAGRKALETA